MAMPMMIVRIVAGNPLQEAVLLELKGGVKMELSFSEVAIVD